MSWLSSGPTGVFRGAVIVVAMRWMDSLLGVLSTLILARLLMPADFGLIAMAAVVAGFLDVFLDLGVASALIQRGKATLEDFDTAWTLRLLQALCSAALMFVVAPLAATYFHDDRVAAILRFMALGVAIGGLENIGVVRFQMNMEFGSDFRFFMYKRLAGTVVTLVCAFALRSYWAMVVGALAGRAAGVVLSYVMEPSRPRPSLANFRRLWGFSQWLLVGNIGAYASTQLDKLIVGGRADAGVMGAYTVAGDVSGIPTAALLMPLGRVLYPAFVSARQDPEELKRSYRLAMSVQVLLVLPAAIGLVLVADSAVPVLLGKQWLSAIPFVQILGLVNLFTALRHSAGYVLLTTGRVAMRAAATWINVALMLVLALLVFPSANAWGIALIRLALALVSMAAILAIALRALGDLSPRLLLMDVWRSFAGCLLMAGTVLVTRHLSTLPAGAQLVVQIVTGAITYFAAVFALWILVGRPEGVEAYLGRKLHLERYWPAMFGRARGTEGVGTESSAGESPSR